MQAVARLAARRTEPVDVADVVTGAVDAGDRWDRVVQAVMDLPEIERDALVLAAWEGLSYDDIAHALQIPIGTVRSRLNRARGRIRELDPASDEEQEHHAPTGDPGRITS